MPCHPLRGRSPASRSGLVLTLAAVLGLPGCGGDLSSSLDPLGGFFEGSYVCGTMQGRISLLLHRTGEQVSGTVDLHMPQDPVPVTVPDRAFYILGGERGSGWTARLEGAQVPPIREAFPVGIELFLTGSDDGRTTVGRIEPCEGSFEVERAQLSGWK